MRPLALTSPQRPQSISTFKCNPPRKQPTLQHAFFNKPISYDPQKPSNAWLDRLARAGVSLAAAALLTFSSPATAFSAEEIYGAVKVVDGDTIVVDGTRIRLFGIDAPETKQSCHIKGSDYDCGIASKEALESKIGTAPVRCAVKRKDMYGRSVAICKLDSVIVGQPPEDLNAWLVQEGHAVAYARYSKAYVPLETAAREEKKGIWNGEFKEPELWRKEHPRGGNSKKVASLVGVPPEVLSSAAREQQQLGDDIYRGAATAATTNAAQLGVTAVPPPSPPAPAATIATSETNLPDTQKNCLIKGNITKSGRLYHVPGGKYYDSVKIDVKAGERWFCSVQEAVAAGWRPAKG